MSLSIIMKMKEKNDLFIIYEVNDFTNTYLFYIGVDLKNKKLNYFIDPNDFDNPILSIDYLDPNKKMETFPNISRGTSNWVIAQIYKATIGKNFPEIISYASL
jgi:hypothetical protein